MRSTNFTQVDKSAKIVADVIRRYGTDNYYVIRTSKTEKVKVLVKELCKEQCISEEYIYRLIKID